MPSEQSAMSRSCLALLLLQHVSGFHRRSKTLRVIRTEPGEMPRLENAIARPLALGIEG